MSRFTRRGVAALVVASTLLLAPLVSTAAYADDEPVVETPLVETPIEEPPVEEAPAAPGEEAPAAPAEEAPAGPAAEAPAAEEPVAEGDESEAPMSFSPMSLAPAYVCDYSPTTYAHYPLYPFCVDDSEDGTSATVFWNQIYTGWDNYFYVEDVTGGSFAATPGFGYNSPVVLNTTPGHQYHVWLEVYNGSGSFYVGQLYYTAASLAPEAPTALTATRNASANAIDLAWAASVESTDNPVDHYSVAVSTAADGVISTDTAPTTAYTATGLTVGTEYTFTVTAVGQNGETSDATTTTATLSAVAPAAVTGLTLTQVDDDLFASWTAPSYDGGASPVRYAVYLYADGTLLDSYNLTSTSFAFPYDAEYSVEYTVTVVPFTAVNDLGPSTTSNAVERADSLPGIPTAYGEAFGYKQPIVTVTWDLAPTTGSDIEEINVVIYDALGVVVDHKELIASATSWSFPGLLNDTDYLVGVSVTNGAGTSTESTRVPVTTLGLVPPPFTPDELRNDQNFAGVTVALTGSTLTAHINGLTAGDWVYGYAHSTPVGLGWTQVDAAGTASWSIAGAGLPAGAHTLAVMSSFGDHLGSAGFTVAAARAALAAAGTDPSGWMSIALAMLALGVVATISRARRQARA